jgi:MIP family channel proteins
LIEGLAVRDASLRQRLGAEVVGTFGIVFPPVALASGGAMAGGDPSLLAAAWVSGLAVLAMIFAFGPISAAHFNPAVTLGFAAAGRFPWRRVPAYWMSQFAGGILAAAAAWLLFGAGAGAHVPSELAATGRNLGTEVLLGFLLMLVIMPVVTDRRVPSTAPPLAIGTMVVVGVFIGGPITGGSMNPARSLGPGLFVEGAMDVYWIYAVGPSLGAVVAALLYEQLRAEPSEAQSAPRDWA